MDSTTAQKSSSAQTRVPLYLFLGLLLFYLVTARGNIRGLDETIMFTTMANAWDHHSLAIDELGDLNNEDGVTVGSYGVGNHLYSKLPPGNGLFAVPFYALGERIDPRIGAALAALLTNTILSAVGMLLLFLFLRRHFRLAAALITTLFTAVATDWWFQTRGFGSEIGAGVFLLATLLAADTDHPLVSGAAFGLSILFRPLNVLAFPAWLLNVFRNKKITRDVWIKIFFSAAIAALFLVSILVYNDLRFRNPFYFGYGKEGFTTLPWLGLLYLFFSPGRSIFLYSPLFILAIPGAFLWHSKDRAMAWTLISTVVIYLLSVACWHSWDGGWSWGSRLLTPVVPLVGILFAPVIELALKKKRLMALAAGLATVGLGIGILALLKDPLWTMDHFVMSGMVPYEDTLFTARHAFLSLHIRELLTNWQPMDIDAMLLRVVVYIFGG